MLIISSYEDESVYGGGVFRHQQRTPVVNVEKYAEYGVLPHKPAKHIADINEYH